MKKTYTRSIDELQEIVTDTERFFERHGVDDSLRMKVDLTIEELFVNMVTYNTESNEDILIEMVPHALGLEVRLTDYDVERFDPTSVAAVDGLLEHIPSAMPHLNTYDTR